MKTSPNGFSIIKQFERLRLTAYKPTKDDVWTLGYGHTKEVKEFDTCTEIQADTWLAEDVEESELCIDRNVTVELNQNQFDALVSFVYNEGAKNFGSSTLLKFLNHKDYEGAAEEFLKWNKQKDKITGEYKVLNGLTIRRNLEKKLFETLV